MEKRDNFSHKRKITKNKRQTNKINKDQPIRGRYITRTQRGRNFRAIRRGRENYGQYQNNIEINFSYEKLKELNNKDEKEIIQYFMNFKDLSITFDNTIFNSELIDLITEILMKLSKINSENASYILYQILKNTNYNDIVKKRLLNEEYDSENYLNFILNLILLNNKLIDKFTDNSIRIKYGEILSYVDIIQEVLINNQYKKNIDLQKIY